MPSDIRFEIESDYLFSPTDIIQFYSNAMKKNSSIPYLHLFQVGRKKSNGKKIVRNRISEFFLLILVSVQQQCELRIDTNICLDQLFCYP